jgi:ApbE superfamily uncharacterized protein (UPF0280 family)
LALKLIREAGLPEPLTEQMLCGFPADFGFADLATVLARRRATATAA